MAIGSWTRNEPVAQQQARRVRDAPAGAKPGLSEPRGRPAQQGFIPSGAVAVVIFRGDGPPGPPGLGDIVPAAGRAQAGLKEARVDAGRAGRCRRDARGKIAPSRC